MANHRTAHTQTDRTGPGKPRADDRETLDAILHAMSSGCRWENLEKTDYSHHYTTAWRRLKRWEEDGTWKRILDTLISKGYSLGVVRMDELSIDRQHDRAGQKGGVQVGYDGHKHIKG
jgi:transposase